MSFGCRHRCGFGQDEQVPEPPAYAAPETAAPAPAPAAPGGGWSILPGLSIPELLTTETQRALEAAVRAAAAVAWAEYQPVIRSEVRKATDEAVDRLRWWAVAGSVGIVFATLTGYLVLRRLERR